MPTEILVIYGILAVLAVALVILAVLFVREVREQRGGRRYPRAKPVFRRRLSPRLSPQLIRSLAANARTDDATAERLMKAIATRNPGRGWDWCYEKAMLDLERDRR
jgi:hypothetical protein